jgi:hypothetical protein
MRQWGRLHLEEVKETMEELYNTDELYEKEEVISERTRGKSEPQPFFSPQPARFQPAHHHTSNSPTSPNSKR